MPDEVALAWELVTVVRPHVSRGDADRVHVAIGAGATFAAIAALITTIARDQITVSQDLLTALGDWLDGYRGHGCEPRLRLLLAQV